MLLVLREPQLARSLVLAESPAITLFVNNNPRLSELLKVLITRPRTAVAIIQFGAAGAAPARQAFRRGQVETGLRIFGNAVFSRGGFDRLPEAQKAQVRENLSNVKAELLGSGFAPLDPNQVGAIRTPVLLMTARHSVSLFHHLLDRLNELLPHAQRTEIEGASHMMQADNASAFSQAIKSFLADHSNELA